jgi:serine/threonine-protein kinase
VSEPPGATATAEDALIGRVIAEKFRIDELVGTGAMGSVYRARHLALKKDVAIKVMKVHGKSDRKYAARFKREAKAASLLDHPNSIRLIDFGQEPDGLLYIAMEYLDGKSLAKVLIEEWPIPDDRIVAVLSQALAALARAHEMAIVHRDLKPENIMLLSGTDDEGDKTEHVKVCDFGVAKFVEDGPTEELPPPFAQTTSSQTTLTAHGMTVGTPAYMSPEQALGDKTDARSDIYQVGVILFQMLTRRLPFEAPTTIKLMLKQVEEPPPEPSRFVPEVNAKLQAVCLKALRKRADQRYQSAREMRADLRAAIDPNAPTAEEFRRARTDPPPPKRTSNPPTRISSPPRARKPVPRTAPQPGIPTAAIVIIACALAVSALMLVMMR